MARPVRLPVPVTDHLAEVRAALRRGKPVDLWLINRATPEPMLRAVLTALALGDRTVAQVARTTGLKPRVVEPLMAAVR